MAGIDAHNSTIYNMRDPVGDNDAATKQYVDKKVRKCKSGLVPYLRANVDNKSGYVISASSEHSNVYSAYKAMKYGSGEWASLAEMTHFWFKVKCLERVRVWRFSALGRGYPGHELVSWIFEGSNDDADWTVLRSESNYVIGHTIALVDIDTNEYFQYYRLFIVLAAGLNAGLAHFQLYVYNE